MKHSSPRFRYSLLAALLVSGVALAAPVGSQASPTTPDRKVSSHKPLPKPGTGNFTKRLLDELRGDDLEVSVGYPALYTQKDCAYTYPVLENCYGNNPAAPYVVPVVKTWPEEYVDPAMTNAFGRTRPGYTTTPRLDPREAIIFYGKMPPPARYLGLQTWIATTGWVSEESPWDKKAYADFEPVAGPLIQYLFGTVPGNESRVQSVSSIENNVNDVVMEDQSGLPWGETRYFVITPDRAMEQAVRDALGRLGVDDSHVFTESIPPSFEGSPVGPLGLDEDAVDFLTFLRYSMPDNARAGDTWRKRLPMKVLRVREDPSSTRPATPYDAATADPRTAVNEVDDKELSDGLENLVDAVVDRADDWNLALEYDDKMIDILNELGQFGPDCRAIGMNCLGDNQDASYFLMPPRPLDTGRVYAVVSTLATETGNGEYVGLSVNDASLLKGVANVPDPELKGSASSYVATVPDHEKYFVHFFARDCDAIEGLTDGECTTITEKMVPLAGDDKAPGDPELHGMYSTAVRAYVKPGSERGADPALQLRPRVLTFDEE